LGERLGAWHLDGSIEVEVVPTPFFDPSGGGCMAEQELAPGLRMRLMQECAVLDVLHRPDSDAAVSDAMASVGLPWPGGRQATLSTTEGWLAWLSPRHALAIGGDRRSFAAAI